MAAAAESSPWLQHSPIKHPSETALDLLIYYSCMAQGGKRGNSKTFFLWSKIIKHLLILMSRFPLFICMIIRKMRSDEVYLFISMIWIQISLKKDTAASYCVIRGVDFPNSTKLLKIMRQEILAPSFASATPNLCGQTSPISLLCGIFLQPWQLKPISAFRIKVLLPTCWNQVLREVEGASLSLNLLHYLHKSKFIFDFHWDSLNTHKPCQHHNSWQDFEFPAPNSPALCSAECN